jgi:hypothetical protein
MVVKDVMVGKMFDNGILIMFLAHLKNQVLLEQYWNVQKKNKVKISKT